MLSEYDTLGEIGSGSFGKVSRVRRKADGKEMARKEINYRNLSEKEKSQIVAEVLLMKVVDNRCYAILG